MELPAIDLIIPGAAVAAIATASFRLFSGRSVRMSSTSQELLELFEDGAPQARREDPPTSMAPAAYTACGRGKLHCRGMVSQTESDSAHVRNRWVTA